MAAALGWLIEICGTLVGHVLIALGISYVSYKGIDAVIGASKAEFYSSLGALSQTTVGLLGVLKVDVCVNMVCSALIGRLTFAGMTSGAVKRMVLK